MPEIQCEKCGEKLHETALSCWACGTLTPLGRRMREAAEKQDDEETWRRSVEAARRRQTQPPPVDPEAVLQQVLAQTGAAEAPQARPAVVPPLLATRGELQELLSLADTLRSVGALLAFLAALGALLLAVLGMLTDVLPPMLVRLFGGLAGFATIGALALFIYFQAKFLAEQGRILVEAVEQLGRVEKAFQEFRASGAAQTPPAQEQAPS